MSEEEAINEEFYQLKVNVKMTPDQMDVDFMFANLRFLVSLPTFLKLNEFSKKLNEEDMVDRST